MSSVFLTHPLIWIIIAAFVLILVLGIVRFFFSHILRFALHGCMTLIIIIALLALLHYFGII